MRIKTEILQSIFIITCEGPSLDASLAQEFLTAMNDFITKSQLDIVLDLSSVNFVDSTGLGSVIHSLNTIDGTGKLILCGVDKRVLGLLKMTRLGEICIQKENRKGALSYLFWERKKTRTTPLFGTPKPHLPQSTGSTNEITEVQNTLEEDHAMLWEVNEEEFEEIMSPKSPKRREEKETHSEKETQEERRKYRRIGHKQIANDDFVIYCNNIVTGRHHPAVVLNISPGGLLMTSRSQLSIGDELLLEGRIGRYFKFKERAVSRSSRHQQYGMEFIDLSTETTQFLTQLTGAVDIIQANKFRLNPPH